jgi:gluconolactonase
VDVAERRIVSMAGLLLVVMAAVAAGQERLPPPPPPPPPEGAPSTPALERLIDGKGEIVRVETGFAAADGLVWADDRLRFTDPPHAQILRWTPAGRTSVVRQPSGGASGLALDRSGRLLAAERDARRVSRADPGGVVTVLDHVAGAGLGGPTDLAVASTGALYVADTTA